MQIWFQNRRRREKIAKEKVDSGSDSPRNSSDEADTRPPTVVPRDVLMSVLDEMDYYGGDDFKSMKKARSKMADHRHKPYSSSPPLTANAQSRSSPDQQERVSPGYVYRQHNLNTVKSPSTMYASSGSSGYACSVLGDQQSSTAAAHSPPETFQPYPLQSTDLLENISFHPMLSYGNPIDTSSASNGILTPAYHPHHTGSFVGFDNLHLLRNASHYGQYATSNPNLLQAL